jgi:flagellar protein FliS
MQGLEHYRSVGAYGAAASADRKELVLRMLDGAQDRIASARGHMQREETASKGEAIGKAIGIIDGLRASLDIEKGGEIAANLDALYDYMNRRLVEANAANRVELLDEVAHLLGEIRTAWQGVMKSAEAIPA